MEVYITTVIEKLTAGIQRTPYAHQREAVTRFADKEHMILMFEMGCVARDTVINLNLSGASKRVTIEELYKKYFLTGTHKNYKHFKCRADVGNRIGLNDIVDVVYSGKKEVYKLELACGKSIKATEDHEILTSKGYVALCALNPDSEIAVDKAPKPVSKRGRSDINYLYTRVSESHPYGRRRTIKRGNKIETYYIVATHRLIMEKHIGMFICPEEYAVHHKNGDPRDNRIENLELLTHEEHRDVHAKENASNFNQGGIGFSKVLSIQYVGVEDTYDIVMKDPHRNFVANGIVVHNCGKTGTSILMARQKYLKEGRLLRTLVVSPPVTLENWRNEWGLWSKVPQSSIHVLDQATGAKKVAYFNNNVGNKLDGSIVVTNYEAFTVNENLFKSIQRWSPELIIFDECHYLKSHNSRRTKACVMLSDKCEYIIMLTGTPILNKVTDIFSQFKILDKGVTFGTNFYVFQSKYMYDANAGWAGKPGHFPDYRANPSTYPELQEKIYKKGMRVLMKDCIDLPPLIKLKELVPFGSEQKKAYDEMEKNLIAFVNTKSNESEAVVAQMAMTKALRMLQIASGYVETEQGTVHEFKDNPKLDRLEEMLDEVARDNKVIIWCSYRHNYVMVERICKKLGLKYVFLTGDQNTKQKGESIEAFNKDPSVNAIIANRASGGVGCNLTAASYSYVYSRNFSLAEELQSEARNYRGGSQIHDRIVKVDLATKDSLDEQVLEALSNKHDVSKQILDILKGKV